MAQENVHLIRRIYDVWSRGESAAPFIADDVEYVNPPYAVEPGTRRGRKAFAGVRDVYDEVEFEIHDVLDAGNDVVVLATIHGTGRGSGVEIDREHGYVWTVRDGLAVRFQWFNDHGEARAAAGLPEA